jgi:hypothetical protein
MSHEHAGGKGEGDTSGGLPVRHSDSSYVLHGLQLVNAKHEKTYTIVRVKETSTAGVGVWYTDVSAYSGTQCKG